jgi:hypothetical protein
MRCAAACTWRTGRLTLRASTMPNAVTVNSTTPESPASRSQLERTAALSVALGYVMRTAPCTTPFAATGIATYRRSVWAVSELRTPDAREPPSAVIISGRFEKSWGLPPT